MMKITEFSLKRAHNEGVLGFLKLVEKETVNLTQEHDQEYVAAYKTVVANYSKAFQEAQKGSNSYTAEVHQADELTERAWSGINNQSKAMLTHPNAQVVEAATEVHTIVKKYGSISSLSYNERYGIVFNLLTEFGKIEASKLAQIQLTEWIEALQSSYDKFMAAYLARIQDESHQEIGLIKEQRTNAERGYATLVEKVNAYCLVFGPANYEVFITNVNQIIQETHALLTSRKTRREKEEEEEAEA